MRTTDTHVYFWEGPFSNWNNCHFKDNLLFNDEQVRGRLFFNTEQAFMWRKAYFFLDHGIAHDILKTSNPQEVKKLGRKIKGYDDKLWSCVRFGFMVYVNYLKFNQNPFYKQILLNTENRVLVEASPYDKIWGVGLAEDDDLILDEKNWLGENLLGKALMEVRELLK